MVIVIELIISRCRQIKLIQLIYKDQKVYYKKILMHFQ